MDIQKEKKSKILLEIADRMWKDQVVSDQEINFVAACLKIEEILDKDEY
jgi:uncharacterized protein YjaG (DUF416 family)